MIYYDETCMETVGGSDERTAMKIQITREDLENLQSGIRWINPPALIADGLSEIKGSNSAVYRVLGSGEF